jgi:hypothetical protein
MKAILSIALTLALSPPVGERIEVRGLPVTVSQFSSRFNPFNPSTRLGCVLILSK